MDIDVWFSRFDGRLYVVTSEHDEPPMSRPRRLRKGDSPASLLKRLEEVGKNVVQVGIVPPEMIGIE